MSSTTFQAPSVCSNAALIPRAFERALMPLGWIQQIALSIVFSLFIAVCARITFPIAETPVPVSLQSFAVLLCGILLGSRLGAYAVLLYLLEGAFGLPFFAGGSSGSEFLWGAPVTGFLLALPFAAFAVGFLAERGFDRKIASTSLILSVGIFIIFGGGILWLSHFIGFKAALLHGVAPFVLVDLCKIIFTSLLLPLGKKIIN